MPGAVSQTPTNWSEPGYGKGFKSTPSSTLKTTVFAPTPAAKVIRVMTVNIGARTNRRKTCRNCLKFINSPRPAMTVCSLNWENGFNGRYVCKEQEVPPNSPELPGAWNDPIHLRGQLAGHP